MKEGQTRGSKTKKGKGKEVRRGSKIKGKMGRR